MKSDLIETGYNRVVLVFTNSNEKVMPTTVLLRKKNETKDAFESRTVKNGWLLKAFHYYSSGNEIHPGSSDSNCKICKRRGKLAKTELPLSSSQAKEDKDGPEVVEPTVSPAIAPPEEGIVPEVKSDRGLTTEPVGKGANQGSSKTEYIGEALTLPISYKLPEDLPGRKAVPHITSMFGPNESIEMYPDGDVVKSFKLKPDKYILIGAKPFRSIAVQFKESKVSNNFRSLLTAKGFKHSHKDWIPHMSLSYIDDDVDYDEFIKTNPILPKELSTDVKIRRKKVYA